MARRSRLASNELDSTQPEEETADSDKGVFLNPVGQIVDTTDAANGQRRQFLICESLGRGGYSKVYVCREMTPEAAEQRVQQAAIKLVDLTLPKVVRIGRQAMFEVEVMRKLRNSSVVINLLSVKIVPKRMIYIVMELAGEPLSKAFSRQRNALGNAPSDFVAQQWRHTLRCVDFIHYNDVVHCDLKPQNFVITTSTGVLKLIDFGCATVLPPFTDYVIRRKSIGTIRCVWSVLTTVRRYMSPEYIRHRMASKELDVWSLGVILYWMFRSTTPFRGGRSEARAAITQREVDLSEIQHSEAVSVLKAIFQKDRERRPSCSKLLRCGIFNAVTSDTSSHSNTQ